MQGIQHSPCNTGVWESRWPHAVTSQGLVVTALQQLVCVAVTRGDACPWGDLWGQVEPRHEGKGLLPSSSKGI